VRKRNRVRKIKRDRQIEKETERKKDREKNILTETETEKEREGERADNKNPGQRCVAQLVLNKRQSPTHLNKSPNIS